MKNSSIHKAEVVDQKGRLEKPVVMVCLQNTTDRKLISQFLSNRYELVLSDFDITAKEFDLCIVDRPTFAQNRQEIIAYKESRVPVTVPFLLFVKGEEWSHSIDPVWNIIDEVVPIPTPTPILVSRIEAMLQIRKHSKELKKKNEQLSMYEQAMDAANVGILLTDAKEKDNPIIYANQGFQKLTGYKKEEIIGRNCRFLQKDDREQDALDDIRYSLAEGEEGHAPLRNYRKDGTLFWNDLHIAPIRDNEGEVTHFVGIQNDITELIETQEKLSEEKERYQLITENATDMVVRNRPDGTFTFVSPSSEKLVGYKPEELVGRSFYEFFHEDDQEKLEETHEAFMNNPGIHKVAYRFKTKSGNWRWMESSVQAICDPQTGEVTEVQGSVRDVTERKEYENKLEKERNLFKKLTEASPDGIYILDKKGQITFVNKQAEEVLGLPKNEIIGLSYNDPKWKLTDTEGSKVSEQEQPFNRVKDKEQAVYDVEQVLEMPDGSRRILSINAAPLLDKSGELQGVIASLADITESKQKEEELEEERKFVQAVVDNLPGIFYMLDEDLNFVFWNKNLVNDLGYSNEEIEQMHALDFIRPEDRQSIIDEISKIYRTGNAEIEIDLIDKQDNAKPHFLMGTKLERKGNTFIIGSAIDITERKRAEYESEQQKKLLSAVINQTESIIYVKDKDWNKVLVNTAYNELFEPGFPTSDKKVDLEKYRSETAEKIRQNDKEVFETGKLHVFKEEIPVGGETRDYLSIKYPLKNVPGYEDCICGISTDITEREKAYKQLKERNKEKACLYSIGNLNEIYNSVEKILEEAVNIIPEGWQYPEACEAAIEYNGKIYATPGFRHTQWGVITESHNYKARSVAIKVVYLEEKPTEYDGPFLKEERELLDAIADTLASEIERIEYREKLEESEKRWQQLVQKNPGLVQILDGDEIVFINQGGANLYGVDSADELIGKSWTEFVEFEEDKIDKVRQRIAEAIEGKVNPPHIYKAWTADGTERYVELQSVPVQYKGNTVLMTVGQEVTDRVKFERELTQSLKEKEILLQEVHHRVKNNLAVISGLLQIQRFSSDDKKVNKVLSNSEMRIKSMALIHEKLYQMESLSDIDLKYYINDLLNAISNTISTGDDIALKLHCESVTLNVNQAVPCGLILNELISNAVEHAFTDQQKGGINIDLKETDGMVRVRVTDNGKGLPDNFEINNSHSMGFTIINTLISQLDAEMKTGNDKGAFFEFTFEKKNVKGSSSTLV